MKILLNNITEILLLSFLIITFLQSGIDKIIHWNGNLSWLKDHFSKTPMKNVVPFMLATVLILEIVAAVLNLIGLFHIISLGSNTIAFYGAILSCIILLMLLFGQRMAKDYAGAMTIAVYFIPTIFLVFLLRA